MSTFIGNIDAKLDEKGRIFVPATYRRILAEQESTTLVMRRDTDNACLIFYPERVWNEKVEQLRQALDEWDPEDQMILMQFMADAEFLEMDSQGRILLSKKNVEMLGESQKSKEESPKSKGDNRYCFVGMMDRFAMWKTEAYEEKVLSPKDLASRIRAKMKGAQSC